eukprot:TRINITY_DN1539_c0_g1_i2.p1 TRINITY_DN1539_c0_g1~~TRINITY_DN1539_c0_g1_i2.p1  ORF type:complete len:102 (-),score=24.18 TRINITY_DN1539_c0_g1_i2:141-446(-)
MSDKIKTSTIGKELPKMMYGFGDVEHPDPESVALLEEITVEYITAVTRKAATVGSKKGSLQPEDIVYVVRKDPKKYARAIELLKVNDEVKRMKNINSTENM